MTQTRRPKRDLPEYTAALEADLAWCRDRQAEFVDYEVHPTVAEAEEMCIECPMFFICKKNARYRKPRHGVWGGLVWINGVALREDTPPAEEIAA